MDRKRVPPEQRFWGKVDFTDTCWVWTGARSGTHRQYGFFRIGGRGGKQIGAHRFSYCYLVDSIPNDLTIDHLCRNGLCVRPDHLEVVSRGENVLRGTSFSAENARKTHCPQGHSYSGSNLYIVPRTGQRQCRSCVNANKRRLWAAQRMAEVEWAR
ncbi:hypothetical protein LCGC14_2731940 [marine sediment metagenome]|uniref:HNH nuclease domain-containing protein n=1 Tax=marine sediment metagenome TaxID=412755 RepID=A0A0F8Z741_9ZZZZ